MEVMFMEMSKNRCDIIVSKWQFRNLQYYLFYSKTDSVIATNIC